MRREKAFGDIKGSLFQYPDKLPFISFIGDNLLILYYGKIVVCRTIGVISDGYSVVSGFII